MIPLALDDVRVLDISQGIAGPLCAKLLADFGADVIKVEPPGGECGRRMPPFFQDDPHPEKSLFFLLMNLNKRGMTLDVETPRGANIFKELARRADIVVESFPPGYLASLGLDHASLERENPGLVMTSITPFGQSGPCRHYKGNEIVAYAMSGIMSISGTADREPLKHGGFQAQYEAGFNGTLATLFTLLSRDLTGAGQHVDVSIQEVVNSTMVINQPFYSWTGGVQGRRRPTGSMFGNVMPCKDGYFVGQAGGGASWDDVADFFGREELKDQRFADAVQRIVNGEALDEILVGAAKDRTMAEMFKTASEQHRMLLGIVQTPADLAGCGQLEARGFYQEVEHPVIGKIKVPFRLWNMTQSPAQYRRPAPLLGQHNAEVYAEILGCTEEEAMTAREPRVIWSAAARSPRSHHSGRLGPEESANDAGRAVAARTGVTRASPGPEARGVGEGAVARLPLEGVRIIDCGHVFAVPYASGLMADLGAEVIKIEGPGRLDITRDGPFAGVHADNQPGADPWNRTANFNLINRGKKSLVLDLSRAEGLEVLRDLIRVSDVFMESFTPRVMRNWGLEYPEMRKLKPDIIMVSNTGYGRGPGPYSQYPAQATTQEATHGLAHITGYRGDIPCKAGQSYVDFLASWACLMGVALALRYRHRFGKGLWLDVGMYQLGCYTTSEYILDWLANNRLGERLGNRHPWYAPQGCYPCAGDDQWCVVSVRDDEEWAALCRRMGRPELAHEARFATNRDRMTHHDEIDAIIAPWTRGLGKFEVMEALQGVGVPAGAVFDARDVNLNPHYWSRGFLETVQFPAERRMGKRVIMGRPWRLSKTPLAVKGPGPALAQHNRDVLQGILGYTDTRYAELERAGVVGTHPTKPRPLSHMEMEERVRQGRLAYYDPGFKERLGIQAEEERQSVPVADGDTPRSPSMEWSADPRQAHAAGRSPAGGAGAG